MIDPLELIRLAKDISSKFADQMCKRDRETRQTMNWINDPTFLYNTSIICFDDAIHWLKWQSINLIATLCLAHFVICLFADLRSFNHLVGLFVYLFGWWCCRIAIVYHRDLSCQSAMANGISIGMILARGMIWCWWWRKKCQNRSELIVFIDIFGRFLLFSLHLILFASFLESFGMLNGDFFALRNHIRTKCYISRYFSQNQRFS